MRACPSTSPDAASRHLFRHLWDPIELRRNPIVASLFVANSHASLPGRDERVAEGIRVSIRRLADSLFHEDAGSAPLVARRRHAIVVQGDLERNPRHEVARGLGLSARQYSRDQHAIRRRIVARLQQELRTPVRSVVAHAVALPNPLARAAVLEGIGMPAEALANVERMVRGRDDGPLAVSALCLRSSILSSHFSDLPAARTALRDATFALERIAPDDANRIVSKAEVELALAKLEATEGAIESAVRRAWHALQMLRRSHGHEARQFRLMATAASFHAYAAQLTGNQVVASESLKFSLQAYRAASGWLGCERTELFLQTAIVLKGLAQTVEAAHYLGEAASVARENGLIVQALIAEITLGTLVLDRGDLAGSHATLSISCAEAERIGHVGLASAAHVYLARWYTQVPQPRGAVILREVERSREHCAPGSPHWIAGMAAESFGHLLVGDLMAADRAARLADDAAVSSGCGSLRSGTLLEMARVAHAQRRKRDATRAIRQAIDVANSNGKMWQAARAQDLAAVIRGERRHRRQTTVVRGAIAHS